MKKTYEKTFTSNIILSLYIVLLLSFINLLFTLKIVLYKKYSAMVIENKKLIIYVPDKELKTFHKTSCFYINNKKVQYSIDKIEETNKKIKGENYVLIYIKTNNIIDYSIGENLYITIQNQKTKAYKIFKIIWEGDKYKNNK